MYRFHVSVVAQDSTGGLGIFLKDREVRTLLQKNVEVFQGEVIFVQRKYKLVHGKDYTNWISFRGKHGSFPKEIKNIQGKDYTIKILITAANIEKKLEDYVATGIIKGFSYEPNVVEQQESFNTTNTFDVEVWLHIFYIRIICQFLLY